MRRESNWSNATRELAEPVELAGEGAAGVVNRQRKQLLFGEIPIAELLRVRRVPRAHRRRALTDVGDLLRPEVARIGTYTVAVFPSEALCWRDILCTGAVSARWPAELAGRLWIYDAATARARIGPRRECLSRPVLRGVRRSGPVGQIFWVESRSRSFELEPYCFAPRAAHGPTAEGRSPPGSFD